MGFVSAHTPSPDIPSWVGDALTYLSDHNLNGRLLMYEGWAWHDVGGPIMVNGAAVPHATWTYVAKGSLEDRVAALESQVQPLVDQTDPNWSTILGRIVDPSEIRPL